MTTSKATPGTIVINLPDGSAPQPEFVRLPARDARETFTGLSLSTLRRLIDAGRIETKVIKAKPTAKKGCVLIRLKSLLNFIESSSNGDGSNTLPPAA